MNRAMWIRAVFLYLSLQSLVLGGWALFGPRSFYDSFPGGGRSWVAVDGPYNEHLVRDVGALNLALLVLFVVAAMRQTRELNIVASAAAVVWGFPHFVYHLFNSDALSTGDAIASVGGLALFVVLPVTVLVRPTGDAVEG